MASSSRDELPPGWEARVSRSTGLTYFLNMHTKRSQWDKPEDPAPFVDEDDEDIPRQVKCSHIMVKHIDSRRPCSWRDDNITRTKEEAVDILRGFRSKIVNKEVSFSDIAKQFSDCSSAKREGDLGYFKKGQMQKPFEIVSFSLKIGQLSQIVETDSGVHIILRTA